MKEIGVSKKKRVAWNKGIKRTEEEKQKQKETVFKKYGVYNVSQVKEVRKKIHLSHSSQEWKDKVKKTKFDRYGDENYNNMTKNLQTKESRYGNKNYNNSNKNTETKRKNHTFNTSSQEIKFYDYLCNKYGKDDIIKEYKSEEYPFNCDFYIKSKDAYIELNIHPCHNFKPYNELEDKDELEKLKLKAQDSDYYKNIIYVWTVSDKLKLETAKNHKLNYTMIYTIKELEDIINNSLI